MSNTASDAGPVCIKITPAERKVLVELTKDGASNREIARRLCVTEDTVKSHIKNVLTKLPHIPHRTALAVALLRRTVQTVTETRQRGAHPRVKPRLELLSTTPPAGLRGPQLGRRYASLAQ